MILRLATHMPQLELFDPEHLAPRATGEPVRRATPEPAQAKHDVAIVAVRRPLRAPARRALRGMWSVLGRFPGEFPGGFLNGFLNGFLDGFLCGSLCGADLPDRSFLRWLASRHASRSPMRSRT